MKTFKIFAIVIVVCLIGTGCAANYTTPAGGVSLADIDGSATSESYGGLTPGTSPTRTRDSEIRDFYRRAPASPFPANIAITRIQDSGYWTNTIHSHDGGRYSVVTVRDVESDEAYETIASLPLVRNIAPIGRILLPPKTDSLHDLRRSAARLRADLILIYTLDTRFTVDGNPLGPLSTISLGLIPNQRAHVTSTAAGVVMDVRTGFIYGTTEASETVQQRASLWSTRLVIDSARMKAEQQAFDAFVIAFEDLWKDILDEHARKSAGAHRPEAPGSRYYTAKPER